MSRSVSNLVGKLQIGRLCCWAALFACLSLAGCTNVNLRGDGFLEDDTTSSLGQLRRRDAGTGATAFSNKARQIEENFGVY